MTTDRKVFALLIDGDNAQPSSIPQILNKLNEYGDIFIKRIYGDWSQDQLKSWRDVVIRHAFETPHRFHGSTNKNATDIALVIDAMDILWEYRDDIDGFCIVSSDSDFTHLVARIRQSNLMVIGIGKKDTAISFQEVCDVFIITEELKSSKTDNVVTITSEQVTGKLPFISFESLFVQAYESAISKNLQNADGSIPLREIRDIMKDLGQNSSLTISSKMPSFVTQMKEAFTSYLNLIDILELSDNNQIFHHVRFNFELIKFWMAYKHVVEIYHFVYESGWVTLPALIQALSELYPIGTHKSAKVLKIIKKLINQYPNIVELFEDADGEEITHYIRIESEFEKFARAYRDVLQSNKISHEDDWVALSPIGSTVRKLYPNFDPLIYRGAKHSQLKKVMVSICQNHSDAIELKHENNTTFIRMKR